ncbi:hypothetical protein N9C31_00760 [Gammaproteobacteria bacterium]|nr:hypothetical protein [Gammaproteobacteria bacterium]
MKVTIEQLYQEQTSILVDEEEVKSWIAKANEQHNMRLHSEIIRFSAPGFAYEGTCIQDVTVSKGDYPKRAVMYHDEHYVLLNFTDTNTLEIYDSLNTPKEITSYDIEGNKLSEWCASKGVRIECKKIYIQQPGSSDCGTLSIANAIHLLLNKGPIEGVFVNPTSIAAIRENWDLNQAEYVPFVEEPAVTGVKKILAVKPATYMPKNEELFNLYVHQQIAAGMDENNIANQLIKFVERQESMMLEQAQALGAAGGGIFVGSEGVGEKEKHQAKKARIMSAKYLLFSALTLLAGAAIAIASVSFVPLVIFTVAAQFIYVTTLEDDIMDKSKNNPYDHREIVGKQSPAVQKFDIESQSLNRGVALHAGMGV